MKHFIGFLFVSLTAIGFFMFALFGWSFLLAFPVKWLWNTVCPVLFKLPEINWWQALCLLLLTGILFRHKASASINEDTKK